MSINSAFFYQLKSALVPLLKRVVALIPTKTSDLVNDSDFATESYVDAAVASGGGSGTGHYVMTGVYTASAGGGLVVTAFTGLDFERIMSAATDTIYVRMADASGNKALLFSAKKIDYSAGMFYFACDSEDGGLYLLTMQSSVTKPEEGFYVEGEYEGVTMYALIRLLQVDALSSGEARLLAMVDFDGSGEIYVSNVIGDSVEKIYDLAQEAKLDRVHVSFLFPNDAALIHLASGMTIGTSQVTFYSGGLSGRTASGYSLQIRITDNAEDVPAGAYSQTEELHGNTVYVYYTAQASSLLLADVAISGSYNDLTGKPSLAQVATSGSYNDLSGKPTVDATPTSGSANAVQSGGVYARLDEVMQVASGKTASYVFDTVAALDAWLAIAANKNKLKTGDVFLIRATDVPDYWWDATTQTKQLLETTKVDLTGYVQEEDLAAVATSGLYSDLSGKPTIPTVPAISTNINTDATSDVKTASPKAVKTFVEGKGYLTQHQSLANVNAVSVNGYKIVVASSAPTSADDHTITIVV